MGVKKMTYGHVIRAVTALEAIEAAYALLEQHGVTYPRKTGDWCMQKQEFTNMREIYNVTIVIARPKLRFHTMLRRGMLLETLDYLLGLNPGYSPNMITFYKQLTKEFNGKLPYSYGERILGTVAEEFDDSMNQFDTVINMLKKEPTSRQGSLIIRRPRDVLTKHTPCTWGYHFQINDMGSLDLTTFMRSQDLLYGLPFDLFSQSMWLEQMALALNLDVGFQIEMIANLHYYEPDEERLTKLLLRAVQVLDKRPSTFLTPILKDIIRYTLDNTQRWPQNRYLRKEEIKLFLNKVNIADDDYWLDYLKLIGIDTNT